MEFKGHVMYLIGDGWCFDLTTFIGYKVTIKNEQITEYKKGFVIEAGKRGKTYVFHKYMLIPLCVQNKAIEVIRKYRKEALLDNVGRGSYDSEGQI